MVIAETRDDDNSTIRRFDEIHERRVCESALDVNEIETQISRSAERSPRAVEAHARCCAEETERQQRVGSGTNG
jgi:hypothetical protein